MRAAALATLLPLRQARLRQQEKDAVGGVLVVDPRVVLERLFIFVLPEPIGQVVTEDFVVDLPGAGELGVIHLLRQCRERLRGRRAIGSTGLRRQVVESVVVFMLAVAGGVEWMALEMVIEPGTEERGELGVFRRAGSVSARSLCDNGGEDNKEQAEEGEFHGP